MAREPHASKSERPDGPHKGRTAANALVTTFALLGSIVLLNWIMNRYPKRLDLTENGVYKLSAYSRDLVKALPDRMNVKLFVSEDLPAPLNQYGRYVADLLDEYKIASNGKLDWERIDTSGGKEEDKKRRADDLAKYKIQKITLERVSESKLEIGGDNYLGVAFVYGDQIESIPQVVGTEGLEYQITGIIRRLTAPKKKKVAFATSEGELTPQQGLQLLSKFLGQDYETTTVTLDKPVGDDVDGLFVIGPKTPFNDKAKYYLDQFLMKGKGLALFVDGMKLEAPQGMQIPGMDQPKLAQPNDINLQDLLGKYGLKVRDDLVFDAQDARGPVPVNGQLYLVNYPSFVAIAGEGLSPASEITKQLGAVVMPFPSSIEIEGDLKDGKGGVKALPLARTTKRSWHNTGFYVFNPTQKLKPPESDADRGPFTLGYQLSGKWKSAFPDGMPGTDPGTSAPDNATALKESPDDTRFLIMASSGMLDDHQLPYQYEPAYMRNLQFAANAADWLIKDDALNALRAKGMTQRPFVPSVDSKVNFWKWFIQLGVPALLIALGLALYFLRAARRASATLESL